MVDHVKHTHRELTQQEAATGDVPHDPFVLAQELLLFSFSDTGRQERDTFQGQTRKLA